MPHQQTSSTMLGRPARGNPVLAAAVSVLAVFLGVCCQTGLAQNGQNGVWYLYPPEGGLTLFSLDTVNVSYISPFDSPNMFTFCDSGKKLIRTQPAGPKNGSVLVYLNFTSSTPCYFNLRPGTQAGFSANSPAFNLSSTPRPVMTTIGVELPASPTPSSSSTSSSSTSAPTGTSSAIPGTTPAGDGASGRDGGNTAQPAQPASDSESLSAGAKAGIGIGAAFGGVGLLATAFFLGRYLKTRNKAAGATNEATVVGNTGGYYGGDYGGDFAGESVYHSPHMAEKGLQPPELEVSPMEMHAASPPAEMLSHPLPPVEMPASYGYGRQG